MLSPSWDSNTKSNLYIVLDGLCQPGWSVLDAVAWAEALELGYSRNNKVCRAWARIAGERERDKIMVVLLSQDEVFGLYSKYYEKLLLALRKGFKKILWLVNGKYVVREQEWNWKKRNQLGCYYGRPDNVIGE